MGSASRIEEQHFLDVLHMLREAHAASLQAVQLENKRLEARLLHWECPAAQQQRQQQQQHQHHSEVSMQSDDEQQLALPPREGTAATSGGHKEVQHEVEGRDWEAAQEIREGSGGDDGQRGVQHLNVDQAGDGDALAGALPILPAMDGSEREGGPPGSDDERRAVRVIGVEPLVIEPGALASGGNTSRTNSGGGLPSTPRSRRAQELVNRARRSSVTQFLAKELGRDTGNGSKSPFPWPDQTPARDINEKGCYGRLKHRVHSPTFELFFGVLILVNACFLALEAQHSGQGIGHDLEYPAAIDAEGHYPWAKDVFNAANWIFGIFFAIEAALKIVTQRLQFFRHLWNDFDLLLVIMWFIEVASHDSTLVSPSVLRVMRLMKVLRLIRLVRSIKGFDALYVMTTALSGSAVVLMWSMVMLILVLMMLALLFQQVLVVTYLDKDQYSEIERREVFEYFGTFSRSLLSMFEMTLANWPPVCRLLVENVSEVYVIPCLLHKLTIGFAVVGVINGVFMQETFKVAATDDTIMVRQKIKAEKTHREKMGALFDRIDKSGDGELDIDEFRAVMGDKHEGSWIQTWLASMDLATSDVDTLYHLIDDGDGRLTVEELCKGVSKLRGPARSIDMAIQMRDHKALQKTVGEMQNSLSDVLRQLKIGAYHARTQASSHSHARAPALPQPTHHVHVTVGDTRLDKTNLHLDIAIENLLAPNDNGDQMVELRDIKAQLLPLLTI